MNGLLFSFTNFLLPYVYIKPLPLLMPFISLHCLFSCFLPFILQPYLHLILPFLPHTLQQQCTLGFSPVPEKAGHLAPMAFWIRSGPQLLWNKKLGLRLVTGLRMLLEKKRSPSCSGMAKQESLACLQLLTKQILKPWCSQHLKPLSLF